MPTIDLPQGTLRYEDVGSGPAVVFIHGLLVNGMLWRKVTLQVAKELRAFDRPVLLLWTPEDRFFPLSLAQRFVEDLPNARLVTIDDAYVFVAGDQPERVAREIARFVATDAETSARATVN